MRKIILAAALASLAFIIVTAAGAPFGLWWIWPVLWVLPQATWYPLVTRLRNIAATHTWKFQTLSPVLTALLSLSNT